MYTNLWQPLVGTVVQALIGILSMVALYGFYLLKQRVVHWLDSHVSASNRSTVHMLAEEAFAYAESVFANQSGPWKLEAASGYLSSRLKEHGIQLSDQEIRGAIETAVQNYNKAVKTAGTAGQSAAASASDSSGSANGGTTTAFGNGGTSGSSGTGGTAGTGSTGVAVSTGGTSRSSGAIGINPSGSPGGSGGNNAAGASQGTASTTPGTTPGDTTVAAPHGPTPGELTDTGKG